MLYLDSSALVKRYFEERGSRQLQNRLDKGDRVFTSDLTYAEVHAAMGRKYLAGDMDRKAFLSVRNKFKRDWLLSLNRIEVNPATTMIRIPDLVERFRLRGGDAIQLAAAIWLRDSLMMGGAVAGEEAALEFGVADARLAEAAEQCGLKVFTPESEG